jgi:hypothetical protein
MHYAASLPLALPAEALQDKHQLCNWLITNATDISHIMLEMVAGAVRKSKTGIVLSILAASIYIIIRPNWPLCHWVDSGAGLSRLETYNLSLDLESQSSQQVRYNSMQHIE